jgi:beta-glucosidase
VRYGEGVFVGHRAYDARGVEPRFPFGHGLSTTRFEIGPVEPDREELGPDEVLRVAVAVRNAGPRAGSEVVQLYVEPPPGPALRPPRELKAFARVALAPGESRTVLLELPPRAFAHWDPSQGRFATAPGEATLRVGRSSRDPAATARVRLRGDAG